MSLLIALIFPEWVAGGTQLYFHIVDRGEGIQLLMERLARSILLL
jgi:hypothetical protein